MIGAGASSTRPVGDITSSTTPPTSGSVSTSAMTVGASQSMTAAAASPMPSLGELGKSSASRVLVWE